MKFKRRYYPVKRIKAAPPHPLLATIGEVLDGMPEGTILSTHELADICAVILAGNSHSLRKTLVRIARHGQAPGYCTRCEPIVHSKGMLAGKPVVRNLWHPKRRTI